MLRAIPTKKLAWAFEVRDDQGTPVGAIRLASIRERGEMRAGGDEYAVSRESLMGAWVAEKDGLPAAKAVKVSAFKRTFEIEHAGRAYILKARSAFRREVELCEGDTPIGTIQPEGFFNRRARALLPDDLPLVLRIFALWLTLLLWKREEEAGTAAAAN